MWSDIDYMQDYRNFEYDNVSYAGLPEFVQDLHADNRKYVPILDAGIAMRPDDNYAAYTEAKYDNVFIKKWHLGSDFIG